MSRKVIVDCDPGIDGAIALCLALFDARLDVVAVTATGGNVAPEQTSRNVQVIIEQLDPPRFPRIGTADSTTNLPAADARHMHGDDGLGNSGFKVSELHHPHSSVKVICDSIRSAPEDVTILALGPLTNIAAAFQRDPEVAFLVDRIIMTGGSVNGVGNVTAAAEFNIFCDPASARAVFRSPTTKTLIPLDVTNQVIMNLDLVDQLPNEASPAGAFLHRIVRYAFRAYRQLGLEGIQLHDAVSLVAMLHPELFETTEMAGDVEVGGELTTGATVFDRRPTPGWRPNMEVAIDVDSAAVTDCILRGLSLGE